MSVSGTLGSVLIHDGIGAVVAAEVDGVGHFVVPSSSDMTTGVSSSEITMLSRYFATISGSQLGGPHYPL